MNNTELINFIWDNMIAIFLFIFSLLPVLPAKIVDKFGYEIAQRYENPNPANWSIMKFITRQLFNGVISEIAINLGLRGTVSLVLFAVVFTDLLNNKTLSNQSLTVIAVAVLSLYLEYLVQNAEEIEFFRLFKYKSKKPKKDQQ
ncbi:hypothetical protein GF360_01010 [candidate division WWE3 bacterium]|nr:hypothetical protein [candidate division WWE3 bacterium]